MRVLVTGGAGFLGSHLCEALLQRGDSVTCVDDLSTGRRDNIAEFADHPKFMFLQLDVSTALNVPGRLDVVAHLASPASPGLPPAPAGNLGGGQQGHGERTATR
jgi:dTDP-glucose 4,6-dehydratase